MLSLCLSLLLLGSAQASVLDYFGRAAAAVAPDCEQYTVVAGDTCLNVGQRNNVTFAQLRSWNSNINIQCSNLEDLLNTEICVSNPDGDFAIPTNTNGATTTATTPAPIPTLVPDETNRRCGEFYQVESGDDCAVLMAESGITREDFLFLNPQVWPNCTNLWLDYFYCIQPVGAITTYPGYGGATTRPPINGTHMTQLPYDYGSDYWANYPSKYPVIPIANGTRLDCEAYLYLNDTTDNSIADCWILAMTLDIEPEEFILWNPSLAENAAALNDLCGCADTEAPASAAVDAMERRAAAAPSVAATSTTQNFAYPCTLASSTSYCIYLSLNTGTPEKPEAPPSPRAAGEIEGCTWWYAPEEGDSCESILLMYTLSIAVFHKMNPSVGEDCSKMALGTYYCLSTYPYGDGVGIPDSESPTNPTKTSATKTTSSSTKTTGTGVVTPSPIQTGMTKSCDKFYKVVKDDGCYDIAQDNKIALEDFYACNPAVKDDCTGMQANVYVCVGIK